MRGTWVAAGGMRQECLRLDLTCVALEMGGLTAQVKGLCLLSPLHKTHSPEIPHGCGSCPPLVPALATGNLPLQVWHMIVFFRRGWRDGVGIQACFLVPMGTVFCLMFRESLEYPLLFQGMRPLARKKPSTENKLTLLAWAARLVPHRRLNLQALSQVSPHDALESGKGKRDQARSRASLGDCCAHPGPVPSPL